MMDLLATARALDDANLKWRVMAAQIEYAQNFANLTNGAKNFALTVMLNPQQVDPSLLAMVAADDVVAEAITVNEGTGAVDTTAVTDADIMRVVAAKWNLVGYKYPRDPLNPGTAAVAGVA